MQNVQRRNVRGRNFVFTWNNPPDDGESCERLHGLRPEFFIYQRERGANGTLHLQGVITFSNPRTIRGVAQGGHMHVEFMRGTIDEAIAYCTKEDTREPDTEIRTYGEQPRNAGRPGGRTDLQRVADAVANGQTVSQIATTFPETFIRYHRGIRELAGCRAERRNAKTEVFWYYGPTGTGKSRAACDQAPNAYWKDPSTSWWDGYEGHEDVIIDDYRTNMCTFSYLLRLFDRYPLLIQVKGGYVQFVAKRVFVTCPHSPSAMWQNRTDEEMQQLERRIEHVTHFGNFFNN